MRSRPISTALRTHGSNQSRDLRRPARPFWTTSRLYPTLSSSGAASRIGWAAWASSCSWSPSCRWSATAACISTARSFPGPSRQNSNRASPRLRRRCGKSISRLPWPNTPFCCAPACRISKLSPMRFRRWGQADFQRAPRASPASKARWSNTSSSFSCCWPASVSSSNTACGSRESRAACCAISRCGSISFWSRRRPG